MKTIFLSFINKEYESIGKIWLNYFIKEYSHKHNAEFSKRYGLVGRDKNFDPNSIGTYNPHFQLDTDLTQVNQLLKFIKFGFGQCMDHVCYDIRNGEMTRKEAVNLVFKYDGKCSEKYILDFCDFIGITIENFWENVEKFRGNMWKKVDNEWINELHELLA